MHTIQILNYQPLVMTVNEVLTAEEAGGLIELAASKLKRAKVSFDDAYGVTDGRSGQNCWLRYDDYPLAKRIGERIAKLAGMPLANAEALQVLHYDSEQEYKAHYDAYNLATARGQRCCRFGGQRLVTALVYLNEVVEGGGTAFPKLGLQVDPAPGKLVLFQNTGDDQSKAHRDSLHAGMPVVEGEKWAFNIWFHARPMREEQNFEEFKGNDLKSAPEAGQSNWCIRTNRAKRIMEAASKQLIESKADLSVPVCWTYWDTLGKSECDLSGLPEATRVLSVLERKIANPLANKGMLPQLLQGNALEHLAPVTVSSVTEAQSLDIPANRVWFVKPWFKTGGKGMCCVRHDELTTLELPKWHSLQLEVDNLLLSDGHKFTSRIYVLLHAGKIYLYRNGFTLRHAVPYVSGSTDYNVQIDHSGYSKKDSPIQMKPGMQDEHFSSHFGRLEAFARTLSPLLQPFARQCDQDTFLVLGIDVLLCQDSSVKLIEINTMPNFIHTEEINREVNIPFFVSVMKTMLGIGDDQLITIG